eukprot:531947-Amphidinium_carterae.1
MLNFRGRDDASFSLVDQWSSRSPSILEESDSQGRDVNQTTQRQPNQRQPDQRQPDQRQPDQNQPE